MDLASLKGMLANRPSLIDYMGGGKTNIFDTLAQARTAGNAATQAAIAAAQEKNGVDNVSLSADAQAILNAKNADGSANPTLSGVQKGALDLFMSFFDDSDIDLTKLSGETLELIKGFQSVIADSGSVTRDVTTDTLEERYQEGNRQVYTLTGTGSRLRIAVDYKDGKPSQLAITDILNGQVEIANITLGEKDGKADTVLLERSQREYVKGSLVDSVTKMPMSLSLYAS